MILCYTGTYEWKHQNRELRRAEEQGRLMGVSTALSSLMIVFGPLWVGATYDNMAPGAPFWSGAILLVLASALLAPVRVAAPAPMSHTEAYR